MPMAENEPPKRRDYNWPKDEFGRGEIIPQMWIWGGIVLIALLLAILSWLRDGSTGSKEAVVYCAQDQVYAEKIFDQFTKETGIRVRALYDSEAVKSVGLANRLVAERAHPRSDV